MNAAKIDNVFFSWNMDALACGVVLCNVELFWEVEAVLGMHFFLNNVYFCMKKEFCSCSHSEISKFHLHEDKANAHAGMSFYDMPRFAVPAFGLVLTEWFWQQPFWGVGRLRLSCKGFAEPQSGRCGDSRLFYIRFEPLLDKKNS